MSDVYATINEVTPETQRHLADILEERAADPRMQEMFRAYLSNIDFPSDAKVLEIGCGTGAVTRILAKWPGVVQAVGVDPSAVFIEKAHSLAQGIPNISFQEGDGRSLTISADTFDVVVVNTTLTHVPRPERLVTEAYRVLRPGGWLGVFDGDYATATVSTGPHDPLVACVDAFRESFVNDPWLVRRLPQLLRAGGFKVLQMQSHGYVEAPVGAYMLTWVERGAEVLLQSGRISKKTANTLKTEAERRNAAKTWFGHIAFASVLGQKPA